MCLTKQTLPSPSRPSEPNGIEVNIRLSENIVIKLIPLIAALLLGAGFLSNTQLATPSPDVVASDEINVLSQE